MGTSGTIEVPLESALEKIVSSKDLTADQKIRAITAALDHSHQELILEQLKIMNKHLETLTEEEIIEVD